MKPEQAKQLREPFPASAIGKLPKPKSKDAPKGNCKECGGWHGLPAIHLDYVGHAAVTDRLLQVDPAWTWEPLAVTPEGLPALDRVGNLWIKLTIAGVTRLGVGDGANAKECISDAIRNAAMRFGVALDLWAKEDLHGDSQAAPPQPATARTGAPRGGSTTTDGAGPGASGSGAGSPKDSGNEKNGPTADDLAALFKLVEERGGDVERTSAGYDTAVKQGKVVPWYEKALAHWQSQEPQTEFERKAQDAIAAADKTHQARARQAQNDRSAA